MTPEEKEAVENCIFNLNRKDWVYKGVLFAQLDNEEASKEYPGMLEFASNDDRFIAGVMALIWIDEEKIWRAKMRLKFHSGNKDVHSFNFGCDSNETIILQELYRLPMKHKNWMKNPSGDGEDLLKLIQDVDMVESIRFIKMEES